jgi:hypothetical protein
MVVTKKGVKGVKKGVGKQKVTRKKKGKKGVGVSGTKVVTKKVNYAKKYANEMERLRPIVQGLLVDASPGTTGGKSLNRKIALGLVHSPPTHSMMNGFFNNHHNYATQFKRFRRHLYDYPNFTGGYYNGRSFS